MTNRLIVRILLPLLSILVLTTGCRPEFTDGECSTESDCFPGELCIEEQCVPSSNPNNTNNTNNLNNLVDMSEDMDDTGNNNTPDMPDEVASVVVTPPTATLDLTETITFEAKPKSNSGMDLDRPVTWATSDPTIATVTEIGLVTAVAPGEVTITATSEGVDGSAVVTVEKKPVATVVIAPDATSLGLGNTVQLAVTVSDANGDELFGREVTFTSSETATATVLGDGLVTAVAVGVATITADVEGVTGTSVITVVPDPVDRVDVTPATVTIEELEETQLTGQTFDANNQALLDRTITWTSSDDTIATVAPDGKVTGVAPGTATITGTSEGKSDTSDVTVIPRPVDSVVVTPNTVALVAGNTEQLMAETRAANGDDLMRPVTWMTSDANIATVDTNGLVTAVAEGTATITATSEGAMGTATLNVAPPVASVFVAPTASVLDPAETAALTATPRDTGGNDLAGRAPAIWMTSDAAVATVDNIGTVTAVAAGTATITATIEGVAGTATITVREPVATVDVAPPSPTIVAGSSQQMTATPKDSGGTPLTGRGPTSWQTTASAIAIVNPTTGLVTAVSAGTATINATIEGVMGGTTITVLAAIASVTVVSSDVGADIGGMVTFTATPKDSNGNPLTGRTCTFTSGDVTVATVNPVSGVATVIGEGDTMITATCEAASGQAPIAGFGAVAAVTVTPANPSIAASATQQFTATLQDSSGHTLAGRTVAWNSATPATATINATGLATGVAAGTTLVTATSEGQMGSTTLTVTP